MIFLNFSLIKRLKELFASFKISANFHIIILRIIDIHIIRKKLCHITNKKTCYIFVFSTQSTIIECTHKTIPIVTHFFIGKHIYGVKCHTVIAFIPNKLNISVFSTLKKCFHKKAFHTAVSELILIAVQKAEIFYVRTICAVISLEKVSLCLLCFTILGKF